MHKSMGRTYRRRTRGTILEIKELSGRELDEAIALALGWKHVYPEKNRHDWWQDLKNESRMLPNWHKNPGLLMDDIEGKYTEIEITCSDFSTLCIIVPIGFDMNNTKEHSIGIAMNLNFNIASERMATAIGRAFLKLMETKK